MCKISSLFVDPYLATADSEGVVVIWKLDENPSTAPDIFAGDGGNGGDADDDEESEEGKPLERWERLSTFRYMFFPFEHLHL